MNRWWRLILVLSALVFLVPGVWAFGWPRSFYEYVARFEPFNLHLFHDAGAFQIGIGAALLAAVVWRDALLVGLFGGAVGAVVHGVSHIVDRNLGGNPADPWVLSALAVLLTAATAMRFAAVYRTGPDDGGDVTGDPDLSAG